jgi:hypothetical protein
MLPVMLQMKEHGRQLRPGLREKLMLLVQYMMLVLLALLKMVGLVNIQSQEQCQL